MKNRIKLLSSPFSEERRNIENFEMFLEKDTDRVFYKTPNYMKSLCKSRFYNKDTFFNIGTVFPKVESNMDGIQLLFDIVGDDISSWNVKENGPLPENLTQDLVNRLPYVPFTSGKYILEGDYRTELGKSGNIVMSYHVLRFIPKAGTLCPFRNVDIHGISNWNTSSGNVYLSPLAITIGDFSSGTEGWGFSSHGFISPNCASRVGPTVNDYLFGPWSSNEKSPSLSKVLTTQSGVSKEFKIYTSNDYGQLSFGETGPISEYWTNGLNQSNGYFKYVVKNDALSNSGLDNPYSWYESNDPENGFYATFLLNGFRNDNEVTVYWCRTRTDGNSDYVPTSSNKNAFTTFVMYHPNGFNDFQSYRNNIKNNNGTKTDPEKLKQYLIDNNFPSAMFSPGSSVLYETDSATVELKTQDDGKLFFECVSRNGGECSIAINDLIKTEKIPSTLKRYEVPTGNNSLTMVLNDFSAKSMAFIDINISSSNNNHYNVVSHIQMFSYF